MRYKRKDLKGLDLKKFDISVLPRKSALGYYRGSFTTEIIEGKKLFFISPYHYVTYCKALFFGDEGSAHELMVKEKVKTSADILKIDKKIPFAYFEWHKKEYSIILDAFIRRFTDKENVKKAAQEWKKLYDKRSSLILSIDKDNQLGCIGNPKAKREKFLDVDSWDGENLIGFALMDSIEAIYFIKNRRKRNTYRGEWKGRMGDYVVPGSFDISKGKGKRKEEKNGKYRNSG